MTARVANWQAELHQVVLAYEHKPYVYGESDCACFAADCVRAITGKDVLGAYRGIYNSRLGAVARMQYRGFNRVRDAAAHELEGIGAAEIDTRLARVGDIGATRDDALAVRMVSGFVARRPKGAFGDEKAVTAWAIGWQLCPTPGRAPEPTYDHWPAWRAACCAYRVRRRAGASDHAAWLAAVAALQAVWPLPDKDAWKEAENAIAYANAHPTWLYGGG